MTYRVVILIREGNKLEKIVVDKETDLINEALDEVTLQVNGLIPKKIVEGILIQKME